jgi:hypothetical protein
VEFDVEIEGCSTRETAIGVAKNKSERRVARSFMLLRRKSSEMTLLLVVKEQLYSKY